MPGGKGIDVSGAITELGGQTITPGSIGGYNGVRIQGLLINAGVITSSTRAVGETRENIIIKERSSGRQYMSSAARPEIGAAEIGELYAGVLQISPFQYLVASGRLPPGVSPNVCGQLILTGNRKGAFTMLDTDGSALQESLKDYSLLHQAQHP